jgi:4'-phosphopantetheinyl transferase
MTVPWADLGNDRAAPVPPGSVWRPSSGWHRPGDEAVDVWLVRTAAVDVSEADGVLDADEWIRARRFVFPELRQRFIATHMATRAILAGWMSIPPGDIRYAYSCPVCSGSHGKPHVEGAGADLDFSVSVSGERALVAVASGTSVGVDIETEARGFVTSDVLSFLDATERVGLIRLDERSRGRAALAVWTRKEAYSKALGAGLALPLESYAVTVPPESPAVSRPAASWPDGFLLAALPVPEPCVATVAWRGEPRIVALWCW